MSIDGYSKWNELKNLYLKKIRGVSVEDLLAVGDTVRYKDHPRYPHQKILLVRYRGVVRAVPCVPHENGWFLKTLYRSRKYTKLFKGEL